MTPDRYPAHLRIAGPVRSPGGRNARPKPGITLMPPGKRDRSSGSALLDRATLVSRLAMIGELSEQAPLSFIAVKVCGVRGLHDRRGCAACEDVLKHVARELQALVRATDSVGQLNASSFGVILQGTGAIAAAAVAARLTYRLNRLPDVLQSVEVRVGAATGIGLNAGILPGAAVDSFEDDAV